MKVIQIMPEFGLAGAEIMCENLTVKLVERGIDVVVVSLYDYHSAITERLEKQGVKVCYLNKRAGLDLRMIVRLYKLFRQEKPDVIHTHRYVMQYAVWAAMLAGVKKRVHTVHSIAEKETVAVAQKLNWLFYHFHHVIPVALSKEIQFTVTERYHLPQERVPVVYNGIDLDRCVVKKSYESNGKLRFLHIGRFAEVKNHFLLIEAFVRVHRKNPDTELVLIGEGPLEAKIRERVAEEGLTDSVIFAGVKENIYPCLNEADVFVLPSLYEGMPMTIIEAMGTGVPVIAANVGGIPSMIEAGENGVLVDADEDALANAMLSMMDEKLRRGIGVKGRKKAEAAFSAETMCNGYCEVYF